MHEHRVYRYYGRLKRHRDPRRSKMLDHRRRGMRSIGKENAAVRRLEPQRQEKSEPASEGGRIERGI